LDSPDVLEDLGLKIEPVQFYDMRNFQWITCTPSFPHAVRKDGFLLLRRPGISCLDFETHRLQAQLRPAHFRDNMPHERATIRAMLAKRRQLEKLEIIDESDIEAEMESRKQHKELALRQKRLREEDEDDRPASQRPRTSQPSPPPAFTRSPSLTLSSPAPIPLELPSKPIYIPSSCIRWPDDMYTMDMKEGFTLIDSAEMKKQHKRLMDRVAAVFERSIPETTYYDQRRRWKQATEEQRQRLVDAGHTRAGLWANFPK